jgi:anaerobic selenocysteine-containing dehydrogenase
VARNVAGHDGIQMNASRARALGIREGDRVEVEANGTRVRGAVKLHAALAPGSVFVAEGTREEPANALTEPLVEVRRVAGPAVPEPSAVPAQVAPSAEGLSEMPPSAPLDIPPVQSGEEAP